MNKTVLFISFLLVCAISIAAIVTSIYLYSNKSKKVEVAVRQDKKTDDDTEMLSIIGAAIALPDEKPTIISVTDREKLQDQEFFKKAQNGDKVVIYEGIRRIFLYRPSARKIIDFAPLVYTSPSESRASAQTKISITPTKNPEVIQATSAGVLGVEEQGKFRLE